MFEKRRAFGKSYFLEEKKVTEYCFAYSCVTHNGKCRRKNQDNYICDGRWRHENDGLTVSKISGMSRNVSKALFGVFDGLGGEECGEIASFLAAKEAAGLSRTDLEEQELCELCFRMNEKICLYAERNEIESMGTTAALLSFGERKITLCNIGDSKIFRFGSGELKQLSTDHIGIAAYGVKPPLYQYLGMSSEEMVIAPYTVQESYRDGVLYMLCTDGLTDMLSQEQIGEILAQTGQDPVQATEQLLEQALARGGRDNITIILCRVDKENVEIPG